MGFTSLVPETPNTRTFFGAHDGEVAHHHDPRHRLAVVARHWSCMQGDWGRHEGTVVGQTSDKHSVSDCLANRLLCACMRSWSSHANCKVCRVVMQEQNSSSLLREPIRLINTLALHSHMKTCSASRLLRSRPTRCMSPTFALTKRLVLLGTVAPGASRGFKLIIAVVQAGDAYGEGSQGAPCSPME